MSIPKSKQVTADTLYKQHNSLFHNEKNGKFSEVSAQGGLNSSLLAQPAASQLPRFR